MKDIYANILIRKAMPTASTNRTKIDTNENRLVRKALPIIRARYLWKTMGSLDKLATN